MSPSSFHTRIRIRSSSSRPPRSSRKAPTWWCSRTGTLSTCRGGLLQRALRPPRRGRGAGYAHALVGDGQCAWSAYGPQDEPLAPPNGEVGTNGMMVTLAGVLADAVTNLFGDGLYQGEKDAALEACTACAGVYGSGAYPSYPGKVLVDETTGGSYNAFGANCRKYLLPAVYDRAK